MNGTQSAAFSPALLARKILSAKSRWHIARSRSSSRYAGRPVLSDTETNDHVARLLRSGRPAMVSRLGSSEIGVWANYQGIRAGASHSGWQRMAARARGLANDWVPAVCKTFEHNAGFFPASPAMLERYANDLGRWLSAADLMAVMFERWEEIALARYAPHCALGQFMGLEPYVHQEPWTLALAGRRVLVVHPFAESIERQFPLRRELFVGKQVLPDFELLTVKAVQSIAGTPVDYPDWFAALESMQDRIAALQFDVAIVGAGAYGMPLAAFIKGLGRQAVHLGGSTQVLFGIKGRRWDDRPELAKFYNPHWTRPLPHEIPGNAQSVEQGCYW